MERTAGVFGQVNVNMGPIWLLTRPRPFERPAHRDKRDQPDFKRLGSLRLRDQGDSAMPSRRVHGHHGEVRVRILNREPAIRPCQHGLGPAVGLHLTEMAPHEPDIFFLGEIVRLTVMIPARPVGPPEAADGRSGDRHPRFIDDPSADLLWLIRSGAVDDDQQDQNRGADRRLSLNVSHGVAPHSLVERPWMATRIA